MPAFTIPGNATTYQVGTGPVPHTALPPRNSTHPARPTCPNLCTRTHACTHTTPTPIPARTLLPSHTQCVNLEMPHDAKYHVYRYEPIIDNTPYVHHFVAWTCYGLSDADAPATPLGSPYDCLGYMECSEFWMGWAPGAWAGVG